MINKAINTIKKFQNPNGPIAGLPIFNAWTFNENWLFNRKHLNDDDSFQKDLDKQIRRAEKITPRIDPSLPPLTGGPDDEYGAYEWWHPRKIYLNQDLVDSNGKPKKGREEDFGTTVVHEKAHSLFWLLWNKSPQAKKMHELKEDADYEDYQILQEIRWRYGFDPKSNLNDDDVDYLKKLIYENGNPFHIKFLNNFKGKLKDVFNLVADSGEKSQKDIPYAKHGIKLPLYLQHFNYANK